MKPVPHILGCCHGSTPVQDTSFYTSPGSTEASPGNPTVCDEQLNVYFLLTSHSNTDILGGMTFHLVIQRPGFFPSRTPAFLWVLVVRSCWPWGSQAGFPWEPTGTSLGSVFSWPEISHMVTLPERGARRCSPATSPRGKEGGFGMHVAISASWVRTVWTDGVTSRGLSGRRSIGSLPQ